MGGLLLHKCGEGVETLIGDGGWRVRCDKKGCMEQPVTEILAEGNKFIRENFFHVSKDDLKDIEKCELVDGTLDGRPTTYYRIRLATPLEKLEYLRKAAIWAEKKAKEEAP